MKLYLIGGLGADERVFKFLNLDIGHSVLTWISPGSNESLKSYVIRVSQQINTNERFGLLGVSFGGIIAIELGKIVTPEFIFLKSSVEFSFQLPKKYLQIGKNGLLNLIPNVLIKPPKIILGYLFGAKNKRLLINIIKDTKAEFIRWALNSILNWESSQNEIRTIRIHGTNDKLIPLDGEAILIEGGGHFMIVDSAKEISQLINEHIKTLL